MEEYKSNSYKSKEDSRRPSDKKVEKVVLGGVKTRKKSEFQKLTNIFISEDVNNVKSYILLDVLVPAVKKAISDIVTNGIDMILYGESGHSKKRSSSSKISYTRFYEEPNSRKDINRRASRSDFDYDDIIFDDRGDAELVPQTMEDMLDRYGVVSVGDLYDLAEISTQNYLVYKYGWNDLRGASVVRDTRGKGFFLKLPKAVPLD